MPEGLRETLKDKVVAYEGGYRGVGKRIGISGASLHRLLKGQAASSKALPALCKLFSVDVLDYLPLTPDQLSWLRFLEDAKAAGRDPASFEAALRLSSAIPKTSKPLT